MTNLQIVFYELQHASKRLNSTLQRNKIEMITSSESSADYTSAKNIIYPELNPEAYLASQDAFKETIRVQNFGVVSLTRKCTHLLAQLLRTSQSDSIHDLDQGEASFKQFIEPSIETHPNLSFFPPLTHDQQTSKSPEPSIIGIPSADFQTFSLYSQQIHDLESQLASQKRKFDADFQAEHRKTPSFETIISTLEQINASVLNEKGRLEFLLSTTQREKDLVEQTLVRANDEIKELRHQKVEHESTIHSFGPIQQEMETLKKKLTETEFSIRGNNEKYVQIYNQLFQSEKRRRQLKLLLAIVRPHISNEVYAYALSVSSGNSYNESIN